MHGCISRTSPFRKSIFLVRRRTMLSWIGFYGQRSCMFVCNSPLSKNDYMTKYCSSVIKFVQIGHIQSRPEPEKYPIQVCTCAYLKDQQPISNGVSIHNMKMSTNVTTCWLLHCTLTCSHVTQPKTCHQCVVASNLDWQRTADVGAALSGSRTEPHLNAPWERIDHMMVKLQFGIKHLSLT